MEQLTKLRKKLETENTKEVETENAKEAETERKRSRMRGEGGRRCRHDFDGLRYCKAGGRTDGGGVEVCDERILLHPKHFVRRSRRRVRA